MFNFNFLSKNYSSQCSIYFLFLFLCSQFIDLVYYRSFCSNRLSLSLNSLSKFFFGYKPLKYMSANEIYNLNKICRNSQFVIIFTYSKTKIAFLIALINQLL